MEEQLLNYIEQELKRGVARPAIKKALLDVGWKLALIEEAFGAVQSKAAAPAPFAETPQNGQGQMKSFDDQESESNGIAQEARPGKGKSMLVAGAVFAIIIIGFALAVAYLDSQDSSWGAGDAGDMGANIQNQGEQKPSNDLSAQEEMLSADGSETAAIIESESAGDLAFGDGATALVDVNDKGEAGTTVEEGATGDDRRKADMKQLFDAQKSWFAANGQYYTCGLRGGDCGGRPYGYPAQIGEYLASMPQDPLYDATQAVCGQSYVYCGLNNASYPHFFCYYAKLEGGGYYTASHAGNFSRSTPPKIFEECAVAD